MITVTDLSKDYHSETRRTYLKFRGLKASGCDVKLARLTRKLDNLMQITKLATVFDIYPDEVEAVAAFSSYQPETREACY